MSSKLWEVIIIILISIPITPHQKVFAENKIVINEFMAHPGTGNNEWVEIYNPDGADISNYWIDDDTDFGSDSGSSSKKSLSSINKDNQKYQYIELSSVLNNTGDLVVLFDAGGNIVDQYEYTDDPGQDVVIGRSPDGTGQFQKLSSSTRGQPNSTAAPAPTPTSQPTPTPTRSPTPSKTPTPGRSSSTANPTTITSLTAVKPTVKSGISSSETNPTEDTASLSGIPTSILGLSSKSADKNPKNLKNKNKKVLINSVSQNNPIPIIIGALFLVGSSIYIAFRIRKSKNSTD